MNNKAKRTIGQKLYDFFIRFTPSYMIGKMNSLGVKYSAKEMVFQIVGLVGGTVAVGFLSKLNAYYIVILAIIAFLCSPSLIIAWFNQAYNFQRFSILIDYLTNIVPIFMRRTKILYALKEVEDLKKEGYKEITLLGQNVNAYGKDLGLGYDFATLLDKVAKIGIPRVRFMTSHPWDFNDAMIEVIKNNENIMPYIHLPLQSGSDAVLRKMNRRYTEESYMALFDKLKANLPDFAFTTDIIVAFPSETEEDFERTLNMVDHCKYDNAFTFIFSPREGTPAYNMENTIPEEEKKSRLMRLNEKVAYYANMNAQKYQDQIVEVLVDGPSKKNKEVMCGYSREYKMVNFIGDCKEGDIVQVKITKANSFSLNGEMVK